MFFDVLIHSQREQCARPSAGLTAFWQVPLQNELERISQISIGWENDSPLRKNQKSARSATRKFHRLREKSASLHGHRFTGCGKTQYCARSWVAQRFTAAITGLFSMRLQPLRSHFRPRSSFSAACSAMPNATCWQCPPSGGQHLDAQTLRRGGRLAPSGRAQ